MKTLRPRFFFFFFFFLGGGVWAGLILGYIVFRLNEFQWVFS